jgi:hypothetical protein
MQKVNSLKYMSKLGGRVLNGAESPTEGILAGSKSSTSVPALIKALKIEEGQTQMQEKMHETRLILRQPTDLSLPATTFETVPGHHESYMGPYGVEMPPGWSFVITVTEVTIEAKAGSEGKGAESSMKRKSST